MGKIRTEYVNVRDNHFGTVRSVETRFANVLTKLGTHKLVDEGVSKSPKLAPIDPSPNRIVDAPLQIKTPESKAASTAPAQVSETQVATALAAEKSATAEQVKQPSPLVLQGKQAPPPAAQPKADSAIIGRVMRPEQDEDGDIDSAPSGKSKRSYSRRDMKPEK